MAQHLHGGHRGRLRARYVKSPESFEDHELLELLLFYAIPQKDTNDLAHNLLQRFGSLSSLLDADAEQIAAVPGMGETSALLFSVIKDFLLRYLREKSRQRSDSISSPDDPGEILFPEYLGAKVERVFIMGMTANQKSMPIHVLAEGDSFSASVNLTDIASYVSIHRPYYLVLAHNHPSGIGLPSDEDFVATDKIAQFLSYMNVILLDHFIFDGNGDYVSLRESGLLDPAAKRPSFSVGIREPQIPESEVVFEKFFKHPVVAEIVTKMKNNGKIS